MTVICWLGIELSARTQFVLLAIEIALLVGLSIWALIKVYRNHPPGSVTPSLSWLNPFNLSMTEGSGPAPACSGPRRSTPTRSWSGCRGTTTHGAHGR